MTGEELNRKYWELRGWRKFYDPGSIWVNPEPQRTDYAKEPVNQLRELPPLHLDANLAIAEARKKHPLWSCTCLDGKFEFWVGGSCGRGLTFGEALLEFEIKDLIAAGGK